MKGLQALIELRRKTDTDDAVIEIRDALWLAQFANYATAPEPPPPDPIIGTSTSPTVPPPPPPFPTPIETVPPPQTPPPAAGDEPQGLISGQPPAGGELRKASRVRTPAASALPKALAIERALRPLRRRKPSLRWRILDEEATVRDLAEARSAGVDVCIPRFRPGVERWFELAIVVDTGPEMLFWKRTTRDLRRLLGRQGAFSDLRQWTLVPSDSGSFELEDNAADRHPFRTLQHPSGRRLVLILTHGTGAHWQDESWQAELEKLAQNTPTGIVQFLPESLWAHTRLGPARRTAAARRPGDPNHRLRLEATWETALDPGARLVPFPVLTLDPALVASWARLVMARKDARTPCVLLGRAATLPEETEDIDAEQRVEQFRSIASPAAFRLLCHLAAVPLTLPVIRIVREAMVPEASSTDVAAILASGLLRVTGPAGDPEMTFFELLPGVDGLLRQSLRRGEDRRTYASVKDEIRRFLEAQIGRQLPEDFSYVFDEEGEFELSAAAKAFVEVNRGTLERLGHHKKVFGTKTRLPGLQVWLLPITDHPATAMLHQVLERSLRASGYVVESVTGRSEDMLTVEVLTKPSGALVTVTAPSRWGRVINFSNQRRWNENYRELVEYIDSTQDLPGELFGVPELPRPHLDRPALENALAFLLGGDPPVRINLTGPSYSGKQVVAAAAVRQSLLTQHSFRGGIYWQPQVTPQNLQRGRRLFIDPGPDVEIRDQDGVIWFDDPDRGTAFEVRMISREEVDHYFLKCGGEAIRPKLDRLWSAGQGLLAWYAWRGVAIREFPDFADYTGDDFFPWLLERIGAEARDGMTRLAVLRGESRLPDALIATLLPNSEAREALYGTARRLCLLRSGSDGWWPVIQSVAEVVLRHTNKHLHHEAIVSYYDKDAGAAEWDDGYGREHFIHHCVMANRQDALERFYNNPDHLLWIIQKQGWQELVRKFHFAGLPEMASRAEELRPGPETTREEIVRELRLRAAPPVEPLAVFIDPLGFAQYSSELVDSLHREGHTIAMGLASADVFVSLNPSGSSSWWERDKAGLFRILLTREPAAPIESGNSFHNVVNIGSGFEELNGLLRQLSGSRGPLHKVPAFPTFYVHRDDIMRRGITVLLDSNQNLLLSGVRGAGRHTVAAALCRQPVLRRRFNGGIVWGDTSLATGDAPMLFVLEEGQDAVRRSLPPNCRCIVIGPPESQLEGCRICNIGELDSTEAHNLIGLHNIDRNSHDAVLRFAGGHAGLICQACRIIAHFGWESVSYEFRRLAPNDGKELLQLAARKLPHRQQMQLADLSILGRKPLPPRELAEYVCAAPIPEVFFALGLTAMEGPLLRILAHLDLADTAATPLHRRVCNFYREKHKTRYPARVPRTETYYWEYIRHHMARDGESSSLPAQLWPNPHWWEDRDWGQMIEMLNSRQPEFRNALLLQLAETHPECAAEYVWQKSPELEGWTDLMKKLQAAWIPRIEGPDQDPEPEARAAIARALGRLGFDNQ